MMSNWGKYQRPLFHFLLHAVAIAALTTLLTAYLNTPIVTTNGLFTREDRLFFDAGKWAIRFLLLSLAMTPLYIYSGWTTALSLRKPAGLWAAAWAGFHVVIYLLQNPNWGHVITQISATPFILMGAVAMLILALLSLTSNKKAMRWLGRNWKRLHRLVYAAGMLATLHALLAFQNSKKLWASRTENPQEIQIYLFFLVILLALRWTLVRALLGRPARKFKMKWAVL